VCRCVACDAYLSCVGEEGSRSILLRITTSACYKATQVETEKRHKYTYIHI
jgi:hypothetical protein